jgi:hypothetical protein
MIRSKTRLKRCSFAFLLVFAIAYSGFAQQHFNYKSLLQKADAGAFYSINLQPDLLAKCKADLSDIRLTDMNGKIVPYIFGNRLPAKRQQQLITFPQIRYGYQADSLTTFVVENKGAAAINQLYIQLRNTTVERTLNLSGSDDLKGWYAIKENIPLGTTDATNTQSDFFEQLLNFPLISYRYLRVEVNNKHKQPVEILKAGTYLVIYPAPQYVKLPSPTYVQHDSATLSTIIIRFKDNYAINQLRLLFSGPKFFKRNITIYKGNGNTYELVSKSIISSADTAGFSFSAKTKLIKIDVTNGDNPPLTLKTVAGYELNQSLIAYLEKGQQYILRFGNDKSSAPDYDIKFFVDSLNKPLQKIDHGQITADPPNKHTLEAKKSMPAWWVWVAIGLVIITLLFLTYKMTSEIDLKSKPKSLDH